MTSKHASDEPQLERALDPLSNVLDHLRDERPLRVPASVAELGQQSRCRSDPALEAARQQRGDVVCAGIRGEVDEGGLHRGSRRPLRPRRGSCSGPADSRPERLHHSSRMRHDHPDQRSGLVHQLVHIGGASVGQGRVGTAGQQDAGRSGQPAKRSGPRGVDPVMQSLPAAGLDSPGNRAVAQTVGMRLRASDQAEVAMRYPGCHGRTWCPWRLGHGRRRPQPTRVDDIGESPAPPGVQVLPHWVRLVPRAGAPRWLWAGMPVSHAGGCGFSRDLWER